MSSWNDTTICYLGTGGSQPGLHCVNGDAEPRKVFDAPLGHSVYCLDVQPRANLLAFGTRSGRVWVTLTDTHGELADQHLPRGLFVNAPVMSVLLLDDERLLTTDAVGRCLLWDLSRQATQPQPLPHNGSMVCSILQLGGEHTWGLTANGELLQWSSLFELQEVIGRGPQPANHAGLARLITWPDTETLIYAAANGCMVCVNTTNGQWQALPAHQGPFLIIEGPDRCGITIGHDDGQALVWKAGSDNPQPIGHVPPGVVSGFCACGSETRLVLVDQHGAANVFRLHADELEWCGVIRGARHRVVGGPSCAEQVTIQIERCQLEAEQLCTAVLADIHRDDGDDIHANCRQLTEMGFPHIAGGLLSYRARLHGDRVAELAALQGFCPQLPDVQDCVPTLLRYAEVLEELTAYAPAWATHQRIQTIDGAHSLPEQLRDVAGALGGTDWIMEENQPLSLTVEVHDVLNAALIGRHVTCRLQSWQSDARIADPREFVNEIVSAARRLDHCGWDSPSVVERTNWINDGRLELATTIILAEGARNGAAAMEFTVRLDPYPTGMLITPAVLLRVEAVGEDQIPQDHNGVVMDLLREVARRATFHAWIQDCCRIVSRILHRRAQRAAMVPLPARTESSHA
jgi:hypothetical protein